MSDPSSNKVFKNHRAVESPFAYATSVFLPSFKNQIQKHKYANSPPAVASQAKPIKELETLTPVPETHAQQITTTAKPVSPGISNSDPHLFFIMGFHRTLPQNPKSI